jgi:hypothetical protein
MEIASVRILFLARGWKCDLFRNGNGIREPRDLCTTLLPKSLTASSQILEPLYGLASYAKRAIQLSVRV